MPNNNERLVEVETQLAHLQRQYDELNQVVVDQSRYIDRLTRQILKWEQELDRVKSAVDPQINMTDEKPPHY
ncbi:SlyX family protein [Stieleria sp. JC731]|uniref:SlyX family protein n=1 Tax=Pirellulaceae TaxID=2691357 RepID=UPI001E624EEC|nr:SlyX family protein [Stieleria sp. JC731]MCC9602484.1 SlyX family protein [Stieleria sp. JC731]